MCLAGEGVEEGVGSGVSDSVGAALVLGVPLPSALPLRAPDTVAAALPLPPMLLRVATGLRLAPRLLDASALGQHLLVAARYDVILRRVLG